MKEKMREKLSIGFAKKPGRVILLVLLILNIALIFVSALLIVLCYPERMVHDGFWKTAFYVTTMILDAGCITSIIQAPTAKEAFLAILCLLIIIIGMIIFTGSAIGYLTNVISNIFESAKSGARRLHLSEHMILINWNSRASEIINDLLYSDNDEQVVILVSENSEVIEKEIENRIADTIERDKRAAEHDADELIKKGKLKKLERKRYIKNHTNHAKVTVIVRQGETYSLKQLNDISILKAKTVIILSNDERRQTCKYDLKHKMERNEKGDTNTIKNLIQVAQLTSMDESRNDQIIVVEVEDEWTLSLVNKVINQKQKEGKCKIVPILVNRVLGQILSQFSIMPELSDVYSELFSNSGLTFYSNKIGNVKNESAFISDFMKTHDKALPVTIMDINDEQEFYYIAAKATDVESKATYKTVSDLNITLNKEYKFEKKHIAILGHNSKSIDIMKGFMAFINEWDSFYELVDILIIDDKEHLEKVSYYKDFQDYISMRIIEADVFDKELITENLSNYIDSNFEDTSILILSDDYVDENDIDANSLTYLIYVQDIISEKMRQSKAGKLERFHSDSIDVVVELINPKNYDVARSYSANNVIISNRYISKMIVQLGDKEEIYSFYRDILTYDETADVGRFTSKELYVKVAERFFTSDTKFPFKTTPAELIQKVYDESPEENKSVLIGNSHHGNNKMFLYDLREEITITADDKLILFSPH